MKKETFQFVKRKSKHLLEGEPFRDILESHLCQEAEISLLKKILKEVLAERLASLAKPKRKRKCPPGAFVI